MIRKIIVRLLSPILQMGVKYYFAKPRKYNYKDIKTVVWPGVFFPHVTISTKMLLQFLEGYKLKGKTFLELGCGTGIISVFAALKGAKVWASDINPKAIENAEFNANKNKVEVETILSDLFDEISLQVFDYIVINPPYYPKSPENDAEKAWYCGEEFEYFEKLFGQLNDYFSLHSNVFMILSEDCKIDNILSIALKNGIRLEIIVEKRKWGELNYIFKLQRNSTS